MTPPISEAEELHALIEIMMHTLDPNFPVVITPEAARDRLTVLMNRHLKAKRPLDNLGASVPQKYHKVLVEQGADNEAFNCSCPIGKNHQAAETGKEVAVGANAWPVESKHGEPNCMKPDCPFCPPIPAQQGSESTKLDIDEILLKHRSDAIAISQGKSNGRDIGTSIDEAKAKLLEWSRQEAARAVVRHLQHLEVDTEGDIYWSPKGEWVPAAEYIRLAIAELQSPQETS